MEKESNTTPVMAPPETPVSQPPLDESSAMTPDLIERKLKELENAILGSSRLSAGSQSPFAPLPTVKTRLEELKKAKEAMSTGSVQSRLPTISPPVFDGTDFEQFCKEFLRFLRLTGVLSADNLTKKDWLIQSCSPKVKKVVETLAERVESFEELLEEIDKVFPKVENSVSLKAQLSKIAPLNRDPSPADVEHLFLEVETIFSKLSIGAMSDEDKLLTLVSKVSPQSCKKSVQKGVGLQGVKHMQA